MQMLQQRKKMMKKKMKMKRKQRTCKELKTIPHMRDGF